MVDPGDAVGRELVAELAVEALLVLFGALFEDSSFLADPDFDGLGSGLEGFGVASRFRVVLLVDDLKIDFPAGSAELVDGFANVFLDPPTVKWDIGHEINN